MVVKITESKNKISMVVGNINQPTKWFSTKTKVYIIYITGNPERCMVIGKARRSKGKQQKIWIPSKYISNLRIKDVYKPRILRDFLGYHNRSNEKAIKDLSFYQSRESINLIVSYRKSPMKHRLPECGGVKVSVYKDKLCGFLKDNKKTGFNEILYYKWMDEEKNWMSGKN